MILNYIAPVMIFGIVGFSLSQTTKDVKKQFDKDVEKTEQQILQSMSQGINALTRRSIRVLVRTNFLQHYENQDGEVVYRKTSTRQ